MRGKLLVNFGQTCLFVSC